ncbi:MAG TPA: hypothetical protein PK978_05660 [Paludibacter sp.]|nr:hypothetical protein [Paludibacter sp.]HPM10026.1 hypothetical protein [Paludibacter sp.]
MIEHLQKLPVEIVERFLELRDAKKTGIPQELADYILQVNEAANLNRRYQSIIECAKRLQKVYPTLSISTCKSRIYDAINYFNSDSSVTSEAWNNYFADQMMKLAEVNLVAHELREVRICFEKARAYRIAASANAINPDRVKFKPQIVSADMELERMGIKKKGLLDAYRKALALIDSRDISMSDKERLKDEVEKELGITEVDYENIK